jgi:PPM family protein phosphatase
MGLRLVHAAATDVGLVRKQNEDTYVALEGLYAVCDGMGGARAGEVASSTACHKLSEVVRAEPTSAGLRRAVRAANREIYRMSLGDPAMQGMGTTLTAAIARPGGVTIAQVGDSRAYLWRGGGLQQLTEDHSLVADLVRRGQLTPEQAAVHPHRSVITRALGTEETAEPDLLDVDLDPGDRLMLCTDGLSGMVGDDDIAAILGGEASPDEMARELLAAALRGGGEDNVTVLVIRAEETEGEGTVLLPASSAASPDPDDTMVGTGKQGGLPQRSAGRDAGGEPVGEGKARPAPQGAAAPSAPVAGATASAPDARRAESPRPAAASSRRRQLILTGAAAVLVAAVAVAAFAIFNSSVYWVGTTQGRVSLYQGLPYKVLGMELYDLVEVGSAEYGELGDHLQSRVDSRELVTKEEGRRFVRSLAQPANGTRATTTTAPRPRPTTTTVLGPGATGTTAAP